MAEDGAEAEEAGAAAAVEDGAVAVGDSGDLVGERAEEAVRVGVGDGGRVNHKRGGG